MPLSLYRKKFQLSEIYVSLLKFYVGKFFSLNVKFSFRVPDILLQNRLSSLPQIALHNDQQKKYPCESDADIVYRNHFDR
jgi:hypothetical protein